MAKIMHNEARAIAHRFIDGHFRNKGEGPRVSIPARPEHDDDLRLTDYIDQQEAFEVEVEKVGRSVKAWADLTNRALQAEERVEALQREAAERRERTSSERTIMHLGRIAYDRLAAINSRALGNAGLMAWWRAEREMARIEEAARSSFKDAIRIVEELRDALPTGPIIEGARGLDAPGGTEP